MPNTDLRAKYADIVSVYDQNLESFDLFHKHVKNFFESRSLSRYVHSVRHRLKNFDHLLDKIERKNAEDANLAPQFQEGQITSDNLFTRITDIAGIRVLHLHISQFEHIHNALMAKVTDGEFTLFEDPKAYTWDPESGNYFESLGLLRELKDRFYTSIHYVLPELSHSCNLRGPGADPTRRSLGRSRSRYELSNANLRHVLQGANPRPG